MEAAQSPVAVWGLAGRWPTGRPPEQRRQPRTQKGSLSHPGPTTHQLAALDTGQFPETLEFYHFQHPGHAGPNPLTTRVFSRFATSIPNAFFSLKKSQCTQNYMRFDCFTTVVTHSLNKFADPKAMPHMPLGNTATECQADR